MKPALLHQSHRCVSTFQAAPSGWFQDVLLVPWSCKWRSRRAVLAGTPPNQHLPLSPPASPQPHQAPVATVCPAQQSEAQPAHKPCKEKTPKKLVFCRESTKGVARRTEDPRHLQAGVCVSRVRCVYMGVLRKDRGLMAHSD